MLIAGGHTNPLKYTIRQAYAYYRLILDRRKLERVEILSLQRIAYHATDDDYKNAVKKLE